MVSVKPIEKIEIINCSPQEDKTYVCILKDDKGKHINTYRDLNTIFITQPAKVLAEKSSIDFQFEKDTKCFLDISRHGKRLICE